MSWESDNHPWSTLDELIGHGRLQSTTQTMLPCIMRRVYPELRLSISQRDGSVVVMWDE